MHEIYLAHIKAFAYSNLELRQLARQHPVQRTKLSFFCYQDLLTKPQQGGFCFQTASLLHDVLSQLGYNVSFCAARIILGIPPNSPDVLALPPTHLVLMVKLDDRSYLLDPGLGSSAPLSPILIPETESLINDNRFYFDKAENVFVLQRATRQNGWFNLMQTDLKPLSQKEVSLNLFKLQLHPTPIGIRDAKTLVGKITENGRKSLLWELQSDIFKYICQEENTRTETVLTVEQAQQMLVTEFNIQHVTLNELKLHCSATVLPLPQKNWTINFPIDNNEREELARNFSCS